MADAALTFLLDNLTEVIKYHVNLASDAEIELEELKKDLGLMKAFLVEAAEKPKKGETFGELDRQIREVVYDTEDTIDSCFTEGTAASASCNPFVVLCMRRLSLAKKVKFIREKKVKPICDMVRARLGDAHTDHEGSSTMVQEPCARDGEKVLPIGQEHVVGFEDEEKTIMNYLMEERKELDVVSIIGMPGLGKTTLAWKIFQNIKDKFSTCIWINVSQEFNARDIFLNILKQFTSEDMSSMSTQNLAVEGSKYLENAKFLLVMDDVWTVKAWTGIKVVLPRSNNMGKVLITSRSSDVGMHASVARKPHRLRFLNQNESWKLLQLKVFGNLEDCPDQLRVTGEDIAQRCDGLPLLIEFIGGILLDLLSRTRERGDAIEDAWTNVSEDVSMHVGNDRERRISDIVAWSYNQLPHDLRDCFLYLGVFPEGHEISAWTLTRLWIAEGFIKQKEGKSLEETAAENLRNLIERNLVMVDKTKPNGEVKTCHVHDVIRQFCKSKASIKEQNLFQEIKKSKQGVFEPPISDIQKYRRFCIHSHLIEFLRKCVSRKQKGQRVRSFLCFHKGSIFLDPKYISAIPETFNLLRILDSHSVNFPEFPKKVTGLTHLRYLTLSCDGLKFLPDAITELRNLQTLAVDTNSRTLEIKASIWKMIQLRHLKTKAAIILALQGEGEGSDNLQTLSRLSPKNCTQDLFNKACNLKRLGIRGDLAILFNATSIKVLDRLENLKLVNDLDYGSAAEGPLRCLPQSDFFPPHITTLTLSATFLEWTHMSTLGMIQTLQFLKLKQNAFTGTSWEVVDGGFRRLQFLLIESTNLRIWVASDHHFPGLKSLVLKNCRDLFKIPFSLKKTLRKLDIENVSRSAADSARDIEEYNKQQMQGQQKGKWDTEFKLLVGSGCE